MTAAGGAGLAPASPLRQVRRIFGLGLIVAAAAAVAALALALRSEPVTPAGPVTIFPASFAEKGFAPGSIRRVATEQQKNSATKLSHPLVVAPHATEWVVARCDRGRIAVSIGGVESAQRCTGRPVGVVALHSTGGTLRISATVTTAQRSDWGIAVYR